MVKTAGVEFFCYHRDRPGSVDLRDAMVEQHWSYMDKFATQLIARGPTMADDGETPTGSVHIIDLLGRTMWEYPGGRHGGNRYLVLGLGAEPAADLEVPPGHDELIGYGPLLSDDGAVWLGTAVLIRAPDADAARAILTPGRYADIEVHNWRFGGRPS